MTYREFHRRVLSLCVRFRDEGVSKGAGVALIHDNCHVVLEAYFATAALGAVFVPINTLYSAREIGAVLADCDPRLLIAARSFLERSRSALGALSTPGDPPRLLSSETLLPPPGVPAYPATDACAAPHSMPHSGESLHPLPLEGGGDDPVQLYYTSGTTGAPKGVILTHNNVATHALAAIAELGLSEKDVWLHAAPLFHLADAWATWAITWVGGRHVVLPRFETSAAFDTIAREGVTITNLVPTMLTRLVHAPEADAGKLQSMRLILSGGAPMALELLKRIEALFPCPYVQTYGLTETSPYLTLSLPKQSIERLPAETQQAYRAKTGRPMLGVELRVIDANGRDVPRDGSSVGEVVVRGPTVTPGYFKQPEATAAAFRDGFFHTGDLAHVEPEGYLTIVDRIKDVINTGGEQVYSTEVENALYAHPAVEEAAVIAVPDDEWGEAVKAIVVLCSAAEAHEAELIDFCSNRLGSFKVPSSIELRNHLPRTGSGKIDKKALRTPFWQGHRKGVH